MSERKDRPEHEQDRGTKAEHGIGREDEGMEDRGTKAESGIRLDMQSSEVRRTPSTDFSPTMKLDSEATGFIDNRGEFVLGAEITDAARQRLSKEDGVWEEADEDADWDDAPEIKSEVDTHEEQEDEDEDEQD